MEKGGWKSGSNWGQRGQTAVQNMLGEEQEKAHEGEGWDKNSTEGVEEKKEFQRGEEKEFEDPELTSSKHPGTLLFPRVAHCLLLLFLLPTLVFCPPASLLTVNTQPFLRDTETSFVAFLDTAAP